MVTSAPAPYAERHGTWRGYHTMPAPAITHSARLRGPWTPQFHATAVDTRVRSHYGVAPVDARIRGGAVGAPLGIGRPPHRHDGDPAAWSRILDGSASCSSRRSTGMWQRSPRAARPRLGRCPM